MQLLSMAIGLHNNNLHLQDMFRQITLIEGLDDCRGGIDECVSATERGSIS